MMGYSPFYLLYRRLPRLPVDMLFGQLESEPSDYRDYVRKWKKGMERAYSFANKNAPKSAKRNKKYYDSKVRSTPTREVLHQRKYQITGQLYL